MTRSYKHGPRKVLESDKHTEHLHIMRQSLCGVLGRTRCQGASGQNTLKLKAFRFLDVNGWANLSYSQCFVSC